MTLEYLTANIWNKISNSLQFVEIISYYRSVKAIMLSIDFFIAALQIFFIAYRCLNVDVFFKVSNIGRKYIEYLYNILLAVQDVRLN